MALKKWIIWQSNRDCFAEMKKAFANVVVITDIPVSSLLTEGEIKIFETEIRKTFPQASAIKTKRLGKYCFPDENCWAFVWQTPQPIQMRNYPDWANTFSRKPFPHKNLWNKLRFFFKDAVT